MAFKGRSTHAGYRYSQQAANGYGHPQGNQYAGLYQSMYASKELNPRVPGFKPSGAELMRYQPPSPVTPSVAMTWNTESHDGELERFVVETHIRHTGDIARMSYMLKQTQVEMHETKETVRQDLQTLQAQLEGVQKQVASRSFANDELAVIEAGLGIFEPEVVPPEVMLKRFDKQTVAQVYLEQAEVAEETARKLREDVDKLLDKGTGAESGEQKQLETVKTKSDPTPEMLTHALAKRSQREEQSHAAETKRPAVIDVLAKRADSVFEQLEVDKADDTASVATVTPESSCWQPLAVRQMEPSPVQSIPATNKATFSWEFLYSEFGGKVWSPGFYFISDDSKLPKQAYWMLEAKYEPFLPQAPGGHGAKLTPFFNSTLSEPGQAPTEQNYLNTPVFVMKEGEDEYTYFGLYSQLRYSDKLEYDRVIGTVPEHVRKYWAYQLADPQRPEWVTKMLMEHFCNRPKYEGPIPTASCGSTPDSEGSHPTLEEALHDYAMELQAWEKDAKNKVAELTAEDIMESFTKADADGPPGLRLWWEYFQCVGYDQQMYEYLLQSQNIWRVKLKDAADRHEQGLAEAARIAERARGQKLGWCGMASAERLVTASKLPARRDPGRPISAPGSANHTTAAAEKPSRAVSEPSEKRGIEAKLADQQVKTPPNGYSADALKAARHFQNSATKAQPTTRKARSSKNGKENSCVPPHLRRK